MANLYKKEDLVAKVAEKMGTPKTKAKETVETVIDAMVDLILDETHDGLDIFGFTKWVVSEVPERTARNPRTSEPIVVEAHNRVSAKISSNLKKAVR